MRLAVCLLAAGFVLAGCASGGPSDSDQQKMIKEWSPENVAREYEKKGMQKEADEVRRSSSMSQQ